MRDIFISYSRRNADAASLIYTRLSEAGYSLWFDRDENMYGGDLLDQLTDGVQLSRYFVALVSSDWIASKYCKAEFTRRHDYTTRQHLTANEYLVLLDDDAQRSFQTSVWVDGGDLDRAADEVLASVAQDGPHYVQACCDNLRTGRMVEESTDALIRAFQRYPEPNMIQALWDVAQTTEWPGVSVDLAARAIHFGLRHSSDPRLHATVMDILQHSVTSDSGILIDKFAYTAGQMQIYAHRRGDQDHLKKYVDWIDQQSTSADSRVANAYAYTRNRVQDWVKMLDAEKPGAS